MKPEGMARRWRRRQAQLLAALPELVRRSRTRGGADEVHRLRVTLRRVRLSVRLGRGFFPEELVGCLRSWASRVSRATSPVRDLDIAIEWLRAVRAGSALVQECVGRRNATWRRRRAAIAALPARLRSGLVPRRGGRQRVAAGLARRFTKLEGRWQDYVREHLPRFIRLGEEDRHEFRRRVRWWRYLRELVLPERGLERDVCRRRLLAVQEALGEIQNLDLVAAAFRRLTPSAELGELQALLPRQQRVQLELSRKALASLKPWLR